MDKNINQLYLSFCYRIGLRGVYLNYNSLNKIEKLKQILWASRFKNRICIEVGYSAKFGASMLLIFKVGILFNFRYSFNFHLSNINTQNLLELFKVFVPQEKHVK